MAEANEKMAYQVVYTYTTETEDKTLTKTFTDYNTSVTDDKIREIGNTFLTNKLFKDAKNGVITALKKVQRVNKKITHIPVNSSN